MCRSTEACGDGGFCEPTGYCSFVDPSCESGRRYGEYAGAFSDRCVPAQGLVPFGEDPADPDGEGPAQDPDDDPTGEGGLQRDPDPTFVFIDDDAASFAAGVGDGVRWTDHALTLEATDGEGTFTSRVFDAGVPVRWSTLQLPAEVPYGAPLPDGAADEPEFLHGVDMTANVLLLHLDALSTGHYPDSSGWGYDAPPRLESHSDHTPGQFGGAARIERSNWLDVDAAEGVGFEFGQEGFTWSTWVRLDEPCAPIVGSDDGVLLGLSWLISPEIYLGCAPASGSCGDDAAPGVATANIEIGSTEAKLCGDTSLADGGWHHVALVKRGHATAQAELWVDGVLEDAVLAEFHEPQSVNWDGFFTVGSRLSTATVPATYDEVAVWRRDLAPDEITEVFARGAQDIVAEVRGCDDPACADDPPFVGSVRLAPGLAEPETPLSLPDMAPARYAQYRLSFTSHPDAIPPRIPAVTLAATP